MLYCLWAILLPISAWQLERRHRRTSQIFSRMTAEDELPSPPPSELPTLSPTQSPTYSEQHFQDICANVASYDPQNTCVCSTEDNSIVCKLPGSVNFPFQYTLLEYNQQTGKIEKGSECYCKDENNCGNNVDDYCLSMTLVGEQNCAIKYLQDGAQCSNNCVPCINDMNTYGECIICFEKLCIALNARMI